MPLWPKPGMTKNLYARQKIMSTVWFVATLFSNLCVIRLTLSLTLSLFNLYFPYLIFSHITMSFYIRKVEDCRKACCVRACVLARALVCVCLYVCACACTWYILSTEIAML